MNRWGVSVEKQILKKEANGNSISETKKYKKNKLHQVGLRVDGAVQKKRSMNLKAVSKKYPN